MEWDGPTAGVITDGAVTIGTAPMGGIIIMAGAMDMGGITVMDGITKLIIIIEGVSLI